MTYVGKSEKGKEYITEPKKPTNQLTGINIDHSETQLDAT